MTQAKTVLDHLTKTETIYYSDHDRYTDNVILLDFDPVKYPYYKRLRLVLDNDARNYLGIATGVGPWRGTGDDHKGRAADASRQFRRSDEDPPPEHPPQVPGTEGGDAQVGTERDRCLQPLSPFRIASIPRSHRGARRRRSFASVPRHPMNAPIIAKQL